MSISLLWAPLLFVHTSTFAAPAAIVASPASPPVQVARSQAKASPQQRMAHHITRLAQAGWHLRDLQREDNPGEREVRVSFTMARGKRAKTASIVYNFERHSFAEFRLSPAPAPTERRLYASESALFEELSYGAPLGIAEGCSDLWLQFSGRDVSLSDAGFEVLLRENSGPKAGASLTQWLGNALRHGELVEVRDERFDDGALVTQSVVFVLDTDGGFTEIRATLDVLGAVSKVSEHHTPGVSFSRRYTKSARLAELVSEGGRIVALGFVGEDLGIRFENGSYAAFEETDFERGELDCGC